MTEDVDALLARLRSDRANPLGALEDIRHRTRSLRAEFGRRVREDADGLPPGIVAALVAASGPDSSLACQRVRRQVDEGLLTWTDLYADPEGTAGPEGRELVRRALRSGPFPRDVPDAPIPEPGDPPPPRRDTAG
ncbi:hypothetical protein ACOACO_02295 [Nocardioides sp. CPCC 205120]|uniref:hypothetical protein n=1 Tax=Nocardioides sp. CPCC 205120 TaxID=3406462 RepID=UPI003B50D0B9